MLHRGAASVAAAAGAAAAGAALAGVAVAAATLHRRLEPAGAPAHARTGSQGGVCMRATITAAAVIESETKQRIVRSPRLTPCCWRRR